MRVAVASAALTVALGTAATVFASPRPVPWIDAPLPLWHLGQPRLIPYRTDARPCSPLQLRVSRGRGGAATGNLLEELNFRNVGRSTCLLRGYPSIEATRPDGRRGRLHPIRGTFFGPLSPSNIAPRQQGYLDFGTGDGCDGGMRKPTIYRNLTFILPDGGHVDGGGTTISAVCGLSMSQFGLRPRYTTIFAPPGTPGTLHAHASVPARARRGQLLRFTVTLTNPTKRTATFGAPCPGYTVALYTASARVKRSYRLNCAKARSIAPGARVTFAMQVLIPSNASSGLAKYGWNLDTEMGPWAGGTLMVSR